MKHNGSANYRAQALSSARSTIPPTMRWTGAIVVSLAIINEVIPPPTTAAYFVGLAAFGATMYLMGVVLQRPRTPAWIIPWVYTVTAMVLVSGILLMYTNRPVGWDIVYVGVLITGFAPLTFGWAPFIVGASYAFFASVLALEHMHTENLIDWVVAVLSAVAIGGMLLGQRLQMIRVLADAEFARDQLVETDLLTGLLNRRGIYSRVETVWAGALRRGEAVNIAFIDIVGLKRANDAHGHDLGDQIIVEVSNAIRESARREDLVARWGGDEFVVLAKGEPTATDDFQQRILANLRMRDAAFAGRWHSDVTVGSATALPDEMGFQELLQQADSNMYARRQRS